MFLDIDKKHKYSTAAIDDMGESITYGSLTGFAEEFYSIIKKRTLIFILSENCIGSLCGYVASLSFKIVPLLLSSNIDRGMLSNLVTIYHPEYLWVPSGLSDEFKYRVIYENYGYSLMETGLESPELYEDLSLLLTTSGSTGSPKLVRHSYSNVETNSVNVATSAGFDLEDKGILILPMHFTMGLFVINSHLFAGATVLMVRRPLTDRGFWLFIRDHKATNISGVPYNYEVLHRLRFFNMDLPDLKLIIQGGGKLKGDLFKEYAEHAIKTGRKFLAAYGQTEGSSRMTYLKPEKAIEKIGSIGKAVPGGKISLIDDKGNEISEMEAVGEMVFQGPNVTLGYALNGDDLKKGDENKGVLHTGDIAARDSEGFYYIKGRISRFLKLYGIRIGLDDTEQLIRSAFNTECMCTGNDEKMIIKVTDKDRKDDIHNYVIEKTGLFHKTVEVVVIDKIPRNEAGKVIY